MEHELLAAHGQAHQLAGQQLAAGGLRRLCVLRELRGVVKLAWDERAALPSFQSALAALASALQHVVAALDDLLGAAPDLARLSQRAGELAQRAAAFAEPCQPERVRWIDVGRISFDAPVLAKAGAER